MSIFCHILFVCIQSVPEGHAYVTVAVLKINGHAYDLTERRHSSSLPGFIPPRLKSAIMELLDFWEANDCRWDVWEALWINLAFKMDLKWSSHSNHVWNLAPMTVSDHCDVHHKLKFISVRVHMSTRSSCGRIYCPCSPCSDVLNVRESSGFQERRRISYFPLRVEVCLL